MAVETHHAVLRADPQIALVVEGQRLDQHARQAAALTIVARRKRQQRGEQTEQDERQTRPTAVPPRCVMPQSVQVVS